MVDMNDDQIRVADLRQDFPILQQAVHGKPLVYLDNGATSQKPQQVIDAVSHFYQHDNANVHRGVYTLSERATAEYEGVRQTVRHFINAQHNHEVIFTRGTTEAVNLVANSFGDAFIKEGDEIILTEMEHHSNIVPWQMLCQRVGATLKVVPVADDGSLDMAQYNALLNEKTSFVALTHVSNVLGTINPIKAMIKAAHDNDTLVLIDGAQAAPHLAIDVQDLDCDFYTFSAHKMYGPTGVGVLYGKEEWLDKMPPYQGGGDMISQVTFAETQYNVLPHKFEAGTPNIAGVIGLGAAIDYIQRANFSNLIPYEEALTHYAMQALGAIPGIQIYGTVENKISVVSFTMDQAHPHDIATILDYDGIAIRAGHHCAMPLMDRYQVAAMARVSLGIYNHQDDIDRLVSALQNVIHLFEKHDV